MKQSLSFFLVIAFIVVVLTAQPAASKKGCDKYGHACYGGHGKRSLGTVEEDVRPDAILQMFPNEEGGEIDPYRRYRLLKIMEQLFGGRSRRISADRLNDIDYPLSSSELFKDNTVY